MAGNIVLRADDTSNNVTILMVALGEGEWDSIEELRLNGLVLNSEKFHCHPGTDGETGTGGVDGDQKIDQWFPAGIQGLTFSRTAYVTIRSEEDIEAPTSEFLVLGKYKTRKVGTYDANGALRSTVYSASPVWQILDMLLMREPAGRIDLATFSAEAAYCAEQITVNGRREPTPWGRSCGRSRGPTLPTPSRSTPSAVWRARSAVLGKAPRSWARSASSRWIVS